MPMRRTWLGLLKWCKTLDSSCACLCTGDQHDAAQDACAHGGGGARGAARAGRQTRRQRQLAPGDWPAMRARAARARQRPAAARLPGRAAGTRRCTIKPKEPWKQIQIPASYIQEKGFLLIPAADPPLSWSCSDSTLPCPSHDQRLAPPGWRQKTGNKVRGVA